MKGTHQNGDFGFNGYNADFNVQPFGQVNGWFDDAVDWVKENVTGGQTTTQVAEAAAQEERRKMLLFGAILLSGVLLVLVMRKKKKS